MSRRVIAAGHVCLDITPVLDRTRRTENVGDLLVPGKLIHTQGVDVHTGGSVANTGLALKMLGSDVTLLGKVGDDAFGKLVERLFAGYGAAGLVVDPGSDTSYSVVLAIPGLDRVFLHDPGANDTFTGTDIPEAALEDAELFHFGYPPLMKKMYEDGGEELAAIFRRVHDKGIATSLDFAAIDPDSAAGRADWQAVLKKVLPYVDFFVPSFEELCYMLDRGLYDRLASLGGDMTEHIDIASHVEPLARTLLEMGCGSVLIKCGTAGLVYCTGDMSRVGSRLGLNRAAWAQKSGFQPIFRAAEVRSATGAGDACIAAYLTAVLLGRDPARSAAIAAAEGACAVTSFDALSGLRPVEELETMIDGGWETNGRI